MLYFFCGKLSISISGNNCISFKYVPNISPSLKSIIFDRIKSFDSNANNQYGLFKQLINFCLFKYKSLKMKGYMVLFLIFVRFFFDVFTLYHSINCLSIKLICVYNIFSSSLDSGGDILLVLLLLFAKEWSSLSDSEEMMRMMTRNIVRVVSHRLRMDLLPCIYYIRFGWRVLIYLMY